MGFFVHHDGYVAFVAVLMQLVGLSEVLAKKVETFMTIFVKLVDF